MLVSAFGFWVLKRRALLYLRISFDIEVAPRCDWLPITIPSPPLLNVSWVNLSFRDFLSLRLVLLVAFRSTDVIEAQPLSSIWTFRFSIASLTSAIPFSLGNVNSFCLKINAGTFQSSSASSNYDLVLILAISSGLNIIENTFLQNFSS